MILTDLLKNTCFFLTVVILSLIAIVCTLLVSPVKRSAMRIVSAIKQTLSNTQS